MGPVVEQLGALPDEDIRAMAGYLASFNQPLSETESAERARLVVLTAQQTTQAVPGVGQRLFSGACASCHHDGDGPRLLGVNTPLALNSNLHSDQPDNLIRVILGGIRAPATPDIGFMPAFRHSLDDDQIAELAIYLRSRHAPGRPMWNDVRQRVSRLRGLSDEH
jgi:nicotinate dehydrogenase subunit B